MSLYSDIQTAHAAMLKFIDIMKGTSTEDVDLTEIGGVVVPSLAKALATDMADRWQGTWNATTNVPALASGVGTEGYMYSVATAGSTTLDGISIWSVNDFVVFHGGAWYRVDGGGGGVQEPGRSIVAAASPVTLKGGYNGIENATTSGTLVCNLPATNSDGDWITTKDETGTASAANPYHIVPATGTIEGNAYLQITTPYGWRKVRWSAARGGAWLQVP